MSGCKVVEKLSRIQARIIKEYWFFLEVFVAFDLWLVSHFRGDSNSVGMGHCVRPLSSKETHVQASWDAQRRNKARKWATQRHTHALLFLNSSSTQINKCILGEMGTNSLTSCSVPADFALSVAIKRWMLSCKFLQLTISYCLLIAAYCVLCTYLLCLFYIGKFPTGEINQHNPAVQEWQLENKLRSFFS